MTTLASNEFITSPLIRSGSRDRKGPSNKRDVRDDDRWRGLSGMCCGVQGPVHLFVQ
jgi:hypothetical protein